MQQEKTARILVVEDSPDFQVLVKRTLGDRFELDCVASAAEALAHAKAHDFDLILLDIVLPDGDGFEVCSELRKLSRTAETPIVFLTGKTEVNDKVTGFSLGADDYVVKPFEPLELMARIESKLQRLRGRKQAEEMLHKGDLKINLAFQKAYQVEEGRERDMDLTPIELKLLLFFIKHEDHTLTRAELLSAIWGGNVYVLDRTIDKHISTLRHKLAARANYIETVPGSGYRFSLKGARA